VLRLAGRVANDDGRAVELEGADHTLVEVVDMGTGLIRFTIGGFKLSMGKGFGTANQFIMWFGPTMAESAMSEASATFYLKTNGAAYFGGGLSSGVFKNAATATTHTHTDTAATGTFGSNWHPRTYVASVDYNYTGQVNATGQFTGTQSYTLYIEKYDGATWNILASIVCGGSHDVGLIPNSEPASFNIAGSITFTDNSGGLTVPNLRARVGSFVSPNFSGTFYSVTETQTLSIQSTEG
jgi:hypothetical protein